MYELDPKSIDHYRATVTEIYYLIEEARKILMMMDKRDLESLKLLYKKLNPRIEKGVLYLGIQQHRDKAEPEESGEVPDDQALLSEKIPLHLWTAEEVRREYLTNIANFDTIVKELYYNKKWKDLWHFLAKLCKWEIKIYPSPMNELSHNREVSWNVVCDFAKRVKQVALERLRILADIKQWKLAQEL